jgi:hypothetical protein
MTDSNVTPEDRKQGIQVVMAFPELIDDYEKYLDERGLRLVRGPVLDEDDMQCYIITTKREDWR